LVAAALCSTEMLYLNIGILHLIAPMWRKAEANSKKSASAAEMESACVDTM